MLPMLALVLCGLCRMNSVCPATGLGFSASAINADASLTVAAALCQALLVPHVPQHSRNFTRLLLTAPRTLTLALCSFEWAHGYDIRFGLFEWYDDGTQRRIMRKGTDRVAELFKEMPSRIARARGDPQQPPLLADGASAGAADKPEEQPAAEVGEEALRKDKGDDALKEDKGDKAS